MVNGSICEMKTKTPEGHGINSMYTTIQSYLDGTNDCAEVVSYMRESGLKSEILAGIMRQLSDFGDIDRYSLLRQECKLFGLY